MALNGKGLGLCFRVVFPCVYTQEGGDPEKQKVRQKLKAREWDELMAKRKLNILEAVVRGCVWEGESPLSDTLRPYTVCMIEPLNSEELNTPEQSASRQQRNDQCEFIKSVKRSVFISMYLNTSGVVLHGNFLNK